MSAQESKPKGAVSKMLDKVAGTFADVDPIERSAKMVKFLVMVIGAFIIGAISVWTIGKLRLNVANCKELDDIYDEMPAITSLSKDSPAWGGGLRDYYIKTAYNCCAGGAFKNDFVNVCALQKCIQQGARCLDFEIYDVDGKPVVGVSSIDSDTVKECYNSVPFEEAMQTVANRAFSSATSPCSADPMLLHFRIMSEHRHVYDQMAEALYRTL